MLGMGAPAACCPPPSLHTCKRGTQTCHGVPMGTHVSTHPQPCFESSAPLCSPAVGTLDVHDVGKIQILLLLAASLLLEMLM